MNNKNLKNIKITSSRQGSSTDLDVIYYDEVPEQRFHTGSCTVEAPMYLVLNDYFAGSISEVVASTYSAGANPVQTPLELIFSSLDLAFVPGDQHVRIVCPDTRESLILQGRHVWTPCHRGWKLQVYNPTYTRDPDAGLWLALITTRINRQQEQELYDTLDELWLDGPCAFEDIPQRFYHDYGYWIGNND